MSSLPPLRAESTATSAGPRGTSRDELNSRRPVTPTANWPCQTLLIRWSSNPSTVRVCQAAPREFRSVLDQTSAAYRNELRLDQR